MSNCAWGQHALDMMQFNCCRACGDIRYPDADERELAAERDTGSPAARAILGRHLRRIGVAMAADPAVAMAVLPPPADGPTMRRAAWNALDPPHKTAILDRVGEILCEARRGHVLLADLRQDILDAVLDG